MSRLREIEVNLESPVSVAAKGELHECETVLLIAPSSKNRKEAALIKSACASIVMKAAEKVTDDQKKAAESKGDKSRVTGAEFMMMMNMAEPDGTKLCELYDAFKNLLLNGCGSVVGEKITMAIFDQLSFDDMEKLFGEYAVAFFLNSLLNSASSGDGKGSMS